MNYNKKRGVRKWNLRRLGNRDVSAEGGGPNKFYPLKDILPLIGGSGRVSSGLGSAGSGSAKTAPAKYFLVRIVQGELF